MTKQYIKTPLSHSKLQMFGSDAQLTFDIYAGNPQLVAWLRSKEEEGKFTSDGRELSRMPIKASTSWPRFRSLLLDLQGMFGETEQTVRVMETLTVNRDDAGEVIKGERQRQALVIYGRDADGFLFIEVRVANRPAARTYFKEDTWHKDMDAQKQSRPNAPYSDLIAKGFIATLIDVYGSVFYNDFDPDFKTKAQRNREEKEKQTEQKPKYTETPPVVETKETQPEKTTTVEW